MSPRTRPPFRADHVGSLLRPASLLTAREQHARGAIPAHELRRIEDDAVREVVRRQEDIGLQAVTDGEFRRIDWFMDFKYAIGGIEKLSETVKVPFRSATGGLDFEFVAYRVHERMRLDDTIFAEDFAFLKSCATKAVPKLTIPSPSMMHYPAGRGVDRDVYPDWEMFYDDLATIYRQQIEGLAALGCSYLQLDDTSLAFLNDPARRAMLGEGAETQHLRYIRLFNDCVADRPSDMAICTHLCRGNYKSGWMAEGSYDHVAEALFSDLDVDGFFLEYDDERSGGFEPLRFLPKGKMIVLGLVTTKSGKLESKDELKRRIDEAAKFVPLDQLCLSPQCGFASTAEGNLLTIDDQFAKLRLIVETAHDVWGDGMSERFDGVVVAGAGPVGLVTALKVARAGIPVLVLDCEPDIIQWPRAIVYHAPTVEMLDRLGLLDELKVAGILKQDYQFRTVDGDILAAPNMSVLTPEDTAYPFNLHMPQHELANAILRNFLKIPGAAVRWNTRVMDVKQDSAGVTLTVENGGDTQELRCGWLVGADGGSSTVRRATGLSFEGYTHPERLVSTNLVYDFEARGYARANFVIDPVHWAVIVKVDRHGLWRVTYGEDASLPEDGVKSRITDHYRALLPDDGPYQLEAFAPFRVHERSASRFRTGRVLLAGDAAHVCNPFGGLGLTSGLLDADLLGDALPAVIKQAAADDLLDRYAEERQRVFREVTGPTAAENKRRLKETDPEKKRDDNERFEKLRDDPQFQRQALTFTYKLVSRPIGVPHQFVQ